MLHPRNWNFLFIRKMRHGFAYACAPITFSGSAEHRRKPRMIRPGPFGKSEDGTDGSSMQDSNADEDYVQTLQRHIAEARLRLGGSAARSATENLTEEEARRLVHELRVHQIELEMQNEALRESQLAVDAVRARYFDLYDMAPVAYCTVSEQGLIWQTNLAAASLFDLTRNALLNQPFSRRIFPEDQDIYYLGRRRLASSGESQCFDLRLIKGDGQTFWASLTLATGQDIDGKPETRIVLSGISARRDTEYGHARIRVQLRKMNADLEGTRWLARDAAAKQSTYVARMREELDNRLQAFLVRLQVSCSYPLTHEQTQGLHRIEAAGESLLSLVDEQLAPASISAAESMSDVAVAPNTCWP